MDGLIKHSIDTISVIDDGTTDSYNNWKAQLELVILGLKTKEEFEYFFKTYINSGIDAKSPSAVTEFYDFLRLHQMKVYWLF